jgi:hypothetical protein
VRFTPSSATIRPRSPARCAMHWRVPILWCTVGGPTDDDRTRAAAAVLGLVLIEDDTLLATIARFAARQLVMPRSAAAEPRCLRARR